MPKLYQEIENIFRFRILSNDEIPSYMKRMSGMGKMDEVAKQALMTLILKKLGEMEDAKNVDKAQFTYGVTEGGAPYIDCSLTKTNESETEELRKQAIKEKRIAAMAKAREVRAAKKTLK